MTREEFEGHKYTDIVRVIPNIQGYEYKDLAPELTEEEFDWLFGVSMLYEDMTSFDYDSCTGFKTIDDFIDDISKDIREEMIAHMESHIREYLIEMGDHHAEEEFGNE